MRSPETTPGSSARRSRAASRFADASRDAASKETSPASTKQTAAASAPHAAASSPPMGRADAADARNESTRLALRPSFVRSVAPSAQKGRPLGAGPPAGSDPSDARQSASDLCGNQIFNPTSI